MVYSIGIILGILKARQMFGARGLSQTYPLDGSALRQATDAIIGMSADDKQPPLNDMITMLDWVRCLFCSCGGMYYEGREVKRVIMQCANEGIILMLMTIYC